MNDMQKISYTFFAIILFGLIGYASNGNSEFNVLDFGANADGKTVNTLAIQTAIDKCSEKGGVVIFPAGNYVSGTLYFKSNVTLHIEKGATIWGSTNLADYPENLPDYTFFRKGNIKRALIYAEGCSNIAIEGEGTINGQGEHFLVPGNSKVSSYSIRPFLIWMIQCNGVRTEGVKLRNSAFWMQHYLACDDVYIHNIDVYNHCNKNNDMLDIDGCHNVRISDCVGDTDDDGITLKSTSGRSNENVVITNCIISSHCNALKTGTESNAGFKNITISNIVIRPSKEKTVIYGKPRGISGIALEVVDGGHMDGIEISNVVIDGAAVPLFIRLGNRGRAYDQTLPKPKVGSIKNIHISNVTAFNAEKHGSSITGIPGFPVENVSLENIRFYYAGGGTTEEANRQIPEKEKSYPDALMFDNLSAYGLFCRHVNNLKMNNVECYSLSADMRPAFYFEKTASLNLTDIQADYSDGKHALIKMKNVSKALLRNIQASEKCRALLQIEGSKTRNIRISEMDSENFEKLVTSSDGVIKKEIKILNTF
jgi:hypothetical protein